MKYLYVFPLILFFIGCSSSNNQLTNIPITGPIQICTGFNGININTLSYNLTTAPSLTIPSVVDWFYVSDSYTVGLCTGVYMFSPGPANQSTLYHPGDILEVYITAADFVMSSPSPINVDVRLGLYDVTQTVLMPGYPDPDSIGQGPDLVGTFSYAPPFGSQPGMLINAVDGNQAFGDFSVQPLILVFQIPASWTGQYQVGAVFQFNTGGDGYVRANYQYHIEGAIHVIH